MHSCASCGKALVAGGKFCPYCGAPAQQGPEGDPLLGRTIGNYRVISPLAAGAMGKIYVAEQTTLGRKVCVKVLQSQLSGDPTLLKRFEREAKAVSALRHPNIAQVIDFGRDQGLLYLVMELVEGKTLRAIVEQEAPTSTERAFQILSQILSALGEAHAAGIVHRDLKPENVLVDRLRDGSDLIKVVDFGIAKMVDEEGREGKLTATGLVCGTPGYMAPEQIAGEAMDGRVDVYAAGVILFELLTGRPPFQATTISELLRLHLTGVPPPPSAIAALPIPPEVDRLVLQALSREREQRVESALEFRRALELFRPSARGTLSGLSAQAALAQPSLGREPHRPCPRCGAQNPASKKFCGECGFQLSGAGTLPLLQPAQGTSAELEALKKLLPEKLVEHLAHLPSALTAEKRNVTVIFGDISGFTTMSESLAPEEVREVMNRCFDGMVEAVHRYDGTVDKFIGDCIMALFGAPTAHEDDPERAVRCALDMLGYLAEVNKTLARPLGMRIGINTGEVVAGGVGGQRQMNYTVMGDVVNTAQRIESHAGVGKVLVSAAVKRLTDRVIAYRELPLIAVKGKSEKVAVFEVRGLGEAQETDPLVGRRQELANLEHLLQQARAGKPMGVLMLGEPGMGKSRLLKEAARLARERGLEVATARAGRFHAPVELELARDLVFSLRGGLPSSPDQADSALQTLTQRGVAEGDVRRLQHLFGTSPALAGFEPEDNRRLDQASLINAFLAVARRSAGLCLLLDDLHLADTASLEHLEELSTRASATPLAIVATARPGESERLLARVPRLDLKPLAPPEVLEVARQQLSGGELPPSVQEIICERASGNPFVTRELVRALIDARVLQLAGGSWRAGEGLLNLQLPESVSLMVSARFDALTQGAKQLLRFGAVAGRVFSLELVMHALEGRSDAPAAVTECINRGFLEHVEQPAGCLQFSQALTRQVVLNGMAKPDLRHAHARLAEALEQGLSSGGEHPAEAMARHFLAGEQHRKAAKYFAAAAERLASRSTFRGAAECYRQAVTLLSRELTRGAAAGEAGWAQLLSLASKAASAQSMVAPEEALSLLEPVLRQAPPGVAQDARAGALRQKGAVCLKLGKVAEAEAALQEAARYLSGAGVEEQASLTADLAAVREAKGDLAGATQLLLEGFKQMAGGRIADRDALWRYLNQLGRLHLRGGAPGKAREFFENARTQARMAKSAVGEVKALTNLAGAVASAGEQGTAASLLGEALELAQKAGDQLDVARIHYNTGRLLLSLGKREEGAEKLRAALQISHSLGWREGIAAAAQALDALQAGPKQARP